MMNRVEMNEEMMEAVVGGREYHVGDHVEVQGAFFGRFGGTCGATITSVGMTDYNTPAYQVKFDNWYDSFMKADGYMYKESDFAN